MLLPGMDLPITSVNNSAGFGVLLEELSPVHPSQLGISFSAGNASNSSNHSMNPNLQGSIISSGNGQDVSQYQASMGGGGVNNAAGGGGAGGVSTASVTAAIQAAAVAVANNASGNGNAFNVGPNNNNTMLISSMSNILHGAGSAAGSGSGSDPSCILPGNSSGNGIMTEYGSGIDQSNQPDTKDGLEELCPVCGDKVSGYHYGLLTCESCKGFFKRTVQNKKVYTCVAERSCVIDKTQRKRCPYCRFQKCMDVGMRLEAVRPDRMRGGRNKFGPMYKRDRAKKLQKLRAANVSGQGNSLGSHVGPNVTLSYPQPNNQHNPMYTTPIHIKQEIQIPQVTSMTSSPDSSPSPLNPTGTGSGSGGNAANPGENGGQSQAANNAEIVAVLAGGGGGVPSGTGSQTGPVVKHQTDPNAGGCEPWNIGQINQTMKKFQLPTGAGGSNPASTGTNSSGNNSNSGSGSNGKMPAILREFVSSLDDREWQTELYKLLQAQSFNQVEVDLFELLCKVLDHNLFAQVDWARNSYYFKELQVDDQMKLLQNSWSEMLILDQIHQRLHNHLPDETTLHNGQKFELLSLALLGVPSMAETFQEIANKFTALKFDSADYVCLKFVLLLNPDVKQLNNRSHVQECSEQVHRILLEYCTNCYPNVPDKFNQLLRLLPGLKNMAQRGEEFLYFKHMQGNAPHATLLMEMLHAKKR